MRVLVTGANGFIGRNVVGRLCDAGHHVVSAVYDRAPRADEVRVDLTRADQLALLPRDIEAVVNAAGIVDPRQSARRMFAVNLSGTRHLLAWARVMGVRHFVQLSSVAVYGPLLLGEERTESTLRLGASLGFPYMQSKALAELSVERSGVPFSILRPPAVLGAGDSVVSLGFFEALSGTGIPMLPGARSEHRVSLSLVEGLAESVLRVLDRTPLMAALHAVDLELSLGELAQAFATEMGCSCSWVDTSFREALRRNREAGYAWLAASARFGQHYTRKRQVQALGVGPRLRLESAISAGLSSLQGG